MASVIRSAGMRGFRGVVEQFGGDAEALAALHHVPLKALDDDDVLVSDVAMAKLLEGAARTLPCPDLGLRISEYQDIGILGPLAVAVQNSPTVGAALECASQFLFLHSPALRFSIVEDPEGRAGEVGLCYGSTEGTPPRQASDAILAFVHRMIRVLVGGSYALHSVHLSHLPKAPARRYTGFFGVEVRFGQDASLLRVPRSLLDRPLQSVDDTLHEIALDYLHSHFAEPGRVVAPKVRTSIDRLLGTSPPRIAAAARLLGIHPRTLQRRLAAEGTSFEVLLDDARRDAAHRLLTRTELPLAQISGLVGLSEQSALTRCVRRWYGTTPSAVRAGGAPRVSGARSRGPARRALPGT
ncbi:AraC family transcriptional regulator [Arthrobacter echini]|uniref:AraC family transcriptional regulator n=1 Tax=Arthrobacter echini TaxID=1529066 RepID=A0A4S5E5N4_9MICC|nr:AraC family transcriptional regulator [Arthrobacter echini]THJ66752.1 AraC family transcriptional regulator [Arthrobacter echini]